MLSMYFLKRRKVLQDARRVLQALFLINMVVLLLEIVEPLLAFFCVEPQIECYYNYKCAAESHN